MEKEKRKLDDIKDDLRIEKERKIIEERQKQNNPKIIPKINLTPIPKKNLLKFNKKCKENSKKYRAIILWYK